MTTYKTSGRVGVGKKISRFFTPVGLIIIAAVIVLITSVGTWWQYVYNSPDRIFWGMVDNSLQTTSFTRTATQGDGQQKIVQVTQTNTTPTQLSNSKSTITQPNALVVTESIGTPSADYVRYSDIKTTQKTADGKDIDFSKIKDIWGKSDAYGSNATNGQLFNESILSVIPFGNLNASQRRALVAEMKKSNVYVFVQKGSQRHGLRTTYDYTVQINPVPYIGVLKQFAKDMGLTQLDAVDPSQYQQTQVVTVDIKVDNVSHELTELSYNKGARVEKLSGYGNLHTLQQPPTKSISVQELQYRLQSIQ